MNFFEILAYSYLALLGAFLLILLFNSYYIKFIYIYFKKIKTPQKANIFYKYIVLIPARNESKVIRNILKSLSEQDYPKDKFDVYVITETEDDPTNKIALEYGYKYFVRTRLENRRRKGFALEEAYKHLKENNIDFDSLIIFDADNILTPSYISKLNDLKAMGYEIGVGVRESTNADTNYISASSALLFNFQSRFVNKARSYLFDKVVISGTGYFIDKKIVEDAGGWIWTGLTEDVDLTRYAYINGIKMGYNSTAIYFDEQPTDLKTLHNQHVRWIWGYMNKGIIELAISKNPKYRKTNKIGRREFFSSINLFQAVEWMLVFHMLVLIGFMIYFSISLIGDFLAYYGIFFAVDILLMLLVCDIANLIELIFSGPNFKLSTKSKFKSIVFGFIFWADWLFAWIDGFIHPRKRKVWVAIEHKGKHKPKRK